MAKQINERSDKHNWVRKVRRMVESGSLDCDLDVGLHELSVSHDDWCGIHRAGYCNCDPDIGEIVKK